MINTTPKKPKQVIIERVDLRSTPKTKKDIFRISIGNIDVELTPEELKTVVEIALSYPEIKTNEDVQSTGL